MSSTSLQTIGAIKAYHHQAQHLVNNYLLADPFIPYTSVLTGIFLCKVVYDLCHFISNSHSKTYIILTKIQRIEWNNRGISTVHAIFISAMSLYFVFWSDLFSDRWHNDLVVFRSSRLSSLGLGLSIGYFIADLGMIFWKYPSLGGLEYIVHHSLSGVAVAYSLFSGEGQLYTYMVLISEITTPEINLRWYLDTAGMKKSMAYVVNGVFIFLAWLVARILLFIYMFYHVYLHYNQATLIPTTVNVHRLTTYRSGFDVTKCNQNCRLSGLLDELTEQVIQFLIQIYRNSNFGIVATIKVHRSPMFSDEVRQVDTRISLFFNPCCLILLDCGDSLRGAECMNDLCVCGFVYIFGNFGDSCFGVDVTI